MTLLGVCDNGIEGMSGNTHLGMQTDIFIIKISIWKRSESCLVVSNSLRSYGLLPTRLLCPWNSPGTNTGVGSHSLLPRIFLSQGSNLGPLHCRLLLYHLNHGQQKMNGSWAGIFSCFGICKNKINGKLPRKQKIKYGPLGNSTGYLHD